MFGLAQWGRAVVDCGGLPCSANSLSSADRGTTAQLIIADNSPPPLAENHVVVRYSRRGTALRTA